MLKYDKYMLRVYIGKPGERAFHFGQGMSGKVEMVGGKSHFQAASQGKNVIYHHQGSIPIL